MSLHRSGRCLCLPVRLSVCLSFFLSACLSVCLFVCLSVFPSFCLSLPISSTHSGTHFYYQWRQGVRCEDCGLDVHRSCMVFVPACLGKDRSIASLDVAVTSTETLLYVCVCVCVCAACCVCVCVCCACVVLGVLCCDVWWQRKQRGKKNTSLKGQIKKQNLDISL
jgi:hypothetical protein